jgi:hypothetical protein
MSQELKNLNLALFIGFSLIQAFLLVVCWMWREKTRFRKVRPFVLCLTLISGFYMYEISAWLSYAVELPCALVVVPYVISLAWFGAIGLVRALALALEGNYAKLVQKEGIKQDDQMSEVVSASQASTYLTVTSYSRHLGLVLRVMTGWVRVNQLHITEMVIVKNSYPLIIVLMSLPAFIACILVVVLTPAYRSCSGCDIFVELPISASICMVSYVSIAMVMVYQAYSVVGFDDQGVVFELVSVGGVLAPMAFVIWILLVVDPGGLQYQNQFNWSLLFVVTTGLWHCVGYYYQFYLQWQQDRSSEHLSIPTMENLFVSEPATKAEFYGFAARHFVTESLNFLEDVKMFKALFFDKAESWRFSKFKNLVEIYIVSGARMEVNISYAMKSQILQLYDQAKSGKANKDLFNVFDEASKEVEQMVHNGAWTDFFIRRRRNQAMSLAVHDNA